MPLHLQVRAALKERAVIGDLVDESGKLKTEAELTEIFGVSRVTIRNAIAPLVEEGVFVRRRGDGTYLRANVQESWVGSLLGFQEVAEIENYKAGAQILSQGMTAEHAARIGEALDERAVWQLRRLRTANGDPIAIEQAYYPPEVGLELEKHQLTDIKVYKVLENELGIDVVKARQDIKAKLADREEAWLLDVAPGSPLLTSERMTLTAQNRVVEYLQTTHHPEHFHFSIDLVRRRS
jgi:GntR family transcriptional regulator